MRDDIDFNVQFCELVEQYPALYDYTKPEYSNRSVQDKIWVEIGLKLGESAKACKYRWKNIRTSYLKNKRNIISPSGSAAKPVKEYYLASSLRYLDNFLKSRPSKSNIVINTDEIDNNDENEYSNMSAGSNAADLQETNLGSSPLRTTPSLPKKTQISLSDVNKSAYEFFSNKNKRTKTKDQNVDDADADMAFFRSMLPDVKIMIPNQKRKLKIGILNLVEQVLKEPASPLTYSTSFVSSESPYRSTPSRESDYNSPVYMGSYGSPTPEQTQTTGAYGGSATQQRQPALQQTQPALQQIQATGAYGGSATQQTQPALQQILATGAYGGSATPQTQPALQQTQPALQQTQPALQQTQPALQQTQPALQQTQSALQQTLPALPQIQATGAYGGSATPQTQPALQQTQPALQQTQSALQQTQPALQQIQATGAYGGSPTQQMQPALQQTQTINAYRGPTQVYLPMYSPVTPNTPQSHQALRQPHDETDFNDF